LQIYIILIIAAITFSSFILALVAILNFAEKKLVAKGNVKILINDDEQKSLQVAAGSNLLKALSNHNIFLPSACGGSGTCGVCKCQIFEGGGDVLPTEKNHLTSKEIKNFWRISCQVMVRGNMKIHIPEEIFSIQKYACEVISNRNVATFIKELKLKFLSDRSMDFKAGGYIQIYIPPFELSYTEFDIDKKYRSDWDKNKLWDLKSSTDEEIFRAYSMANYPAEGDIIILNIRIATPPPKMNVATGIASSYLFNLKAGSKVNISGPYGEFFIKETEREMIYIGGGAGMAPMRSHLFHLFKTLKTKRKVSYFYGARSKQEMFYHEEFFDMAKKYPNFSYTVALSEPLPEDNWRGPTGFIHQVVKEKYLINHPDPGEIEYYLCGPPMMVEAVNKMLYYMGVEDEMIAYDVF
jgi:Na+-transporting NADH:ubiquinone oxidoreductase subunit F